MLTMTRAMHRGKFLKMNTKSWNSCEKITNGLIITEKQLTISPLFETVQNTIMKSFYDTNTVLTPVFI